MNRRNTETNLALYQELISCNHKLYFWSYSPDFELLHTNCPSERIDNDSAFLASQSESLLTHAQNGRKPFVLDSFLNILWIADFERENDRLMKIHIIGPAFSGKNSYEQLKSKLDQKNFSVPAKLAVLKNLDSIPILPTNLLFQYAIMLHYCITGEKISSQDFQYPLLGREDTPHADIRGITDEHLGIWGAEQNLMNLLREGSPDYKAALERSSSLSSGVKFDVGDSLRKAKNNFLVLLTLCSRAAIEGGLSPSISYSLCDGYTQKSENAESISETTLLCRVMLEDYIQRVHQARLNTSLSKPVQSCCDYIAMHITEAFTLTSLASRAGYTEYYFSRRFKQEMGCSIAAYISQEKIKHAKLLLSSTTMSILEISMELSFRSRSYFSDTFQRIVGEAPSEYRRKYMKI